MWVLELHCVDQVDTEIAVHGFITQDVLILFCSTHHFVLTTKCENLCKADIEEQAFHQTCEYDQGTQQFLIVFQCTGLEFRISQRLDKRDQELILVANRSDFVISVEDLPLVQTE